MKDGAVPLLKAIRASGMVDHYVLLGEGNMRRWDWEKIADRLEGRTQDLWRFLLLGEKWPKAKAERLLGRQAVGFLTRHKLCRLEKGHYTLGSKCLLSFRDHLFFADMGSGQRTMFSDETRALISLLPRMKKGRCLCLYPSTGAEVLPLAAGSRVQVCFLQADRKSPLLGANLEMDAGQTPEFITKAEARKGPFDLMTATPASCVVVPGLPLPKSMAGGEDGCDWIREALKLARSALAPKGRLVQVFLYFADTDSAAMETQMRELLAPFGLSYRLLVTGKMLLEPGVPIFNQLVALSAHFSPKKKPEDVVAEVLAYMKEKNYGAVYLVKGIFTRPGREGVRGEITNYSDDYYGAWTF